MDFKAFFFAMPPEKREAWSNSTGSSKGLLTQVAYGNKRVELGFADVLVALSGGAVSLDEVPLTDNAKRQRALREGAQGGAQVESVKDAA